MFAFYADLSRIFSALLFMQKLTLQHNTKHKLIKGSGGGGGCHNCAKIAKTERALKEARWTVKDP